MELSEIIRRVPALSSKGRDYSIRGTFTSTTNRTLHVAATDDSGESYVIRIAGPTTKYLDRAVEAHNAKIACDLGLAPPVLHLDDEILVTRFIADAHPMNAADLAQEEPLMKVAAMLKRLQQSPAPFKGVRHPFGEIDNYITWHPHPRAVKLREAGRPVEQALARHAPKLAPAHVDASAPNFIRCPDGKVLLVDWEFSTMADPCWDIASVLMQRNPHDASAERFVAAVLGDASARTLARVSLFRVALCLVAGSWCAMEAEARRKIEADGSKLSDLADHYLDRFEALMASAEIKGWMTVA